MPDRLDLSVTSFENVGISLRLTRRKRDRECEKELEIEKEEGEGGVQERLEARSTVSFTPSLCGIRDESEQALAVTTRRYDSLGYSWLEQRQHGPRDGLAKINHQEIALLRSSSFSSCFLRDHCGRYEIFFDEGKGLDFERLISNFKK